MPPSSESPSDLLLAQAPYASVLLDASGQVAAFNSAAQQLCGTRLRAGEPLERALPDAIRPEYGRYLARAQHSEAFQAGASYRGGDGMDHRMSFHFVRFPAGLGVYLFETVDAASYAPYEAQQARLWRELVEHTSDAVLVANETGSVTDWSTSAVELTGLPAEAVLQRPVWELQWQWARPERRTPAELQRLKTEVQRLLQTGVIPAADQLAETELVHVAGATRVIQTAWASIPTERGYRIIAIMRDITQHQEMEAALRRSEHLHRTWFTTMRQGVVIQAQDGRIVAANPAAERILGLNLEQLTGRTSADHRWHAIHEDGSPFPGETHPAMEALRSGCEIADVMMGVFNPAESTYRWIRVNAYPQFPEGAFRPDQVISTFEDVTERRQMEAELRRSEARFRQVIENSLDAAYQGDLRTDKFVYLSPVIQGIVGYGADEIKALSLEGLMQFVHPDDQAQVRQGWAASQADPGHAHQVTYRFRHKTGRYGWVQDYHQVLADDTGRARYRIGSLRDVTAAKEAEREIRQLEQEKQAILDNAPVGISLMVNRVQIWVNRKTEAMFGYPKAELEGHSTRLLYPSQAAFEQLGGEAYPVIAQGLDYETVQELVRQDGAHIWVRYRGRAVDRSELSRGTIWILEDITERRAVDLALRESEEQFRLMADAAPVMIWRAGVDKLCNYFNQGWFKFTGRTLAQELGNGWAEGIHPDDFERSLSIYFAAFEARQSFAMEYRLRRFDGEYRWIMDNGAPRFLANGELAGYIGSCVDITEYKQAEEMLRRHNEDLTRFNRVAVGREIRMLELKREVNDLCRAAGQTLRYQEVPPDNPGGEAVR